MSRILLKTIKITLDDGSIEKAIEEIMQFKNDLANALAELARYVTEEKGPGIAKMYLAQFPAIDTGALHDSIRGEYDASNHAGTIFAGEGLEDGYGEGSYAVYVEYGTGIIGETNPHPDPNGYAYDVNDHGMAGWWYPSKNGTYRPKDGGGIRLAWTRGMAARPFMYNTMLELEAEVEHDGGRIIAEYIP